MASYPKTYRQGQMERDEHRQAGSGFALESLALFLQVKPGAIIAGACPSRVIGSHWSPLKVVGD